MALFLLVKPVWAGCPCGYEYQCWWDPAEQAERCDWYCAACDDDRLPTCFLPGTKVWVIENGTIGQLDNETIGQWGKGTRLRLTEKNIEEIGPGEAVLSFTVDGRPTVRKVLKQLVHQSSKGYLQITLANGTVLKVTEEHPFLTKLAEKALKDNGRFSGYYTPAGKLRPGDTLYQTTPGRPAAFRRNLSR